MAAGDLASGVRRALQKYSRSCDEARRLGFNPKKAIPIEQWPEDERLERGGVVRGKNMERYIRYLHTVASENERLAAQATAWWQWWEKARYKASKAGFEPQIAPELLGALKASAARRLDKLEGLRASAGAPAEKPRRRKAGGTRRRSNIDLKAIAAVQALLQRGENWRPCDVARELGMKSPGSLTGTKPGKGGSGRVARCPMFMKLWQEQKRAHGRG